MQTRRTKGYLIASRLPSVVPLALAGWLCFGGLLAHATDSAEDAAKLRQLQVLNGCIEELNRSQPRLKDMKTPKTDHLNAALPWTKKFTPLLKQLELDGVQLTVPSSDTNSLQLSGDLPGGVFFRLFLNREASEYSAPAAKGSQVDVTLQIRGADLDITKTIQDTKAKLASKFGVDSFGMLLRTREHMGGGPQWQELTPGLWFVDGEPIEIRSDMANSLELSAPKVILESYVALRDSLADPSRPESTQTETTDVRSEVDKPDLGLVATKQRHQYETYQQELIDQLDQHEEVFGYFARIKVGGEVREIELEEFSHSQAGRMLWMSHKTYLDKLIAKATQIPGFKKIEWVGVSRASNASILGEADTWMNKTELNTAKSLSRQLQLPILFESVDNEASYYSYVTQEGAKTVNLINDLYASGTPIRLNRAQTSYCSVCSPANSNFIIPFDPNTGLAMLSGSIDNFIDTNNPDQMNFIETEVGTVLRGNKAFQHTEAVSDLFGALEDNPELASAVTMYMDVGTGNTGDDVINNRHTVFLETVKTYRQSPGRFDLQNMFRQLMRKVQSMPNGKVIYNIGLVIAKSDGSMIPTQADLRNAQYLSRDINDELGGGSEEGIPVEVIQLDTPSSTSWLVVRSKGNVTGEIEAQMNSGISSDEPESPGAEVSGSNL